MNSFYVHIFAVLTVFATPIFSQPDDPFNKLFKAKAPIKEIMTEIVTIDPITNYYHFQKVRDHIQKKDNYASYAKSLVDATQKILDHILDEINYNGKVKVENFIDNAYGMVSGTSLPDNKTLNLLLKVSNYGRKVYEEAAEEIKKKVVDRLMGVIEGGQSKGKEESAAKKKPASDDLGADGSAKIKNEGGESDSQEAAQNKTKGALKKQNSQLQRSKSLGSQSKKESSGQNVQKMRRNKSKPASEKNANV